jgi:hypothetical protein
MEGPEAAVLVAIFPIRRRGSVSGRGKVGRSCAKCWLIPRGWLLPLRRWILIESIALARRRFHPKTLDQSILTFLWQWIAGFVWEDLIFELGFVAEAEFCWEFAPTADRARLSRHGHRVLVHHEIVVDPAQWFVVHDDTRSFHWVPLLPGLPHGHTGAESDRYQQNNR